MPKDGKIQVLCWSELTEPKDIYPRGISGVIADYLNQRPAIAARTATLTDPDQGVGEEVLAETDVLIWFGHVRHNDVSDEAVARIKRHVEERGMGFLGLHSTHFAKPYKALMGTSCAWRAYVEDGKSAKILVADPQHPIAKGVQPFIIPREEWYGEPYDVPAPESVVFVGIYTDNREVARDGLTWTVGKGRVFYWRPGHETYPIYHMPEVLQIMENGVRWCAKWA
ncbi:MAG: trehalose utilization protein ThuA [Candidatus Poribacteria bacterium]|nr:MAG: trehalose utilization protein ThuA [Candidatus Poribacteria bacterium]